MSDSPSASTPATEWILVVSSASSRLILGRMVGSRRARDRKSTRLNSSHSQISYAVFCLKKKNRYLIHLDDAVAVQVLEPDDRTVPEAEQRIPWPLLDFALHDRRDSLARA